MSKSTLSNDIKKEFPRFMMCTFSHSDANTEVNFLNSLDIGYQQSVSSYVPHYFEIEILSVDKNGFRIFFRSADKDVSLDKYKDSNGDIIMVWDKKTSQYISRGFTYTSPWSKNIISDNILLVPEKNVSFSSKIKNLLTKKIVSL